MKKELHSVCAKPCRSKFFYMYIDLVDGICCWHILDPEKISMHVPIDDDSRLMIVVVVVLDWSLCVCAQRLSYRLYVFNHSIRIIHEYKTCIIDNNTALLCINSVHCVLQHGLSFHFLCTWLGLAFYSVFFLYFSSFATNLFVIIIH